FDFACHELHNAVRGPNSVNTVAGSLPRVHRAIAVAEAEGRISKDDVAVGQTDDVVRAAEVHAVVVARHCLDAAVRVGTADEAADPRFAGQQTALKVIGVAGG